MERKREKDSEKGRCALPQGREKETTNGKRSIDREGEKVDKRRESILGGREREYSVGDEAQPQIYERQPPRALLRFILFTLFFLLLLSLHLPLPLPVFLLRPFVHPPFGTAVAAALRPCVPPSLVPSRLYLAPSVYLFLSP